MRSATNGCDGPVGSVSHSPAGTDPAVHEALGHEIGNKSPEGYPGSR